MSDRPLLPAGAPGTWNHSESGHPFLFQDNDGRDYLFYQGNNSHGKTWYLSVLPIEWDGGRPVLAPESQLPPRRPLADTRDAVKIRHDFIEQ